MFIKGSSYNDNSNTNDLRQYNKITVQIIQEICSILAVNQVTET